MRHAAAVSEHPLATHAVGEVIGQVLEALGEAPDAALLFVTGPFAGALEDLAATVRATLRPRSLVASTASGVLAGSQEVEGTAAVALFALCADADPDDGTRCEALVLDASGAGAQLRGRAGTLVVLADPHSSPVGALLDDLRSRAPDLAVVGGLASAATGPGGNRLAADAAVLDRGAVGLLLPPWVRAAPLVSQGCHPVGAPLVVTRAQGTLIEEIAGTPALDLVLALAEEAPPTDRARMARSLHLGVVVDEHQVEFDRGDFVVQPVHGGDKTTRAVAVEVPVPVGTTIQFQVRDATAAGDELRTLLADAPGTAALVFTGAERGRSLFGTAGHDAAIIHEHVEGGATAGMFTAGEIGPVGGRSFLHHRSASVLLLGP